MKARLEATDPQLISKNTLTDLTNQSDSLVSHVKQYQETSEFGDFTNAQSHLESLIVTSSELPPLPSGEAESVVYNAAVAFRTELDNLKDQTQRDAATFAEDFSQMREQLATVLEETKQNYSELGSAASQRAEELENSLYSAEGSFGNTVTEFESRVTAEVQRLESAILEQVQRLDSAISDSSGRFNALEQRWLQENSNSREEQRAEFQALVESSTETAKIHNDYLRETGEKAAEVLGITAASGVAEAYRTYANEQQKQANIWRLVACGSFIGAIGAGYISLMWFGLPDNSSLGEMGLFFATRAPLALAIAGFAAFANKESGHHRRSERENRRLANELTTFRPFLAELSETDRNEQVKQAVSRYYTGHQNAGEPQEAEGQQARVED